MSDSCDPMDCSLPGSSVMGFPRQEYWSGLPFPSPLFFFFFFCRLVTVLYVAWRPVPCQLCDWQMLSLFCGRVIVCTWVFMSSGQMPRSGIAESCISVCLTLLKNCQLIFQSGCTILHHHEQCIRVSVVLDPCQYLVLSFFSPNKSSSGVL